MCCIKLLFSCVAFWPCPVFCCPAGHPAAIFFLKPSSKILVTIPSTMMLLVQNTPSSSSSNPFKYDTLFYLGSSVGERNVFCSAVSVIVSLGMHCWQVPVPYSHFGGRPGTAACGWHPQEDLKPPLGTSKKENENWMALRGLNGEQSCHLYSQAHWHQKEASCHFTSSFLYPLASWFFYSKFLFLVPWGTNQISHATGSNSVVLHKMGARMSKFS